MRIDLKHVPAPARYKLVVDLGTGESPVPVCGPRQARRRPYFENDWDVWVYPPKVDTQPPQGVVMAEDLDDQALATLNSGGKVLLLIPPSRVKGDQRGKVELGFSSIFWNTAWTRRQPPTTLGILCDPKHPGAGGVPDGVSQQLAMVVSHQPGRGHDSR